jgi:hypothetical protein
MQQKAMYAILTLAIAGPVFRYALWLPGRHFVRWLRRRSPKGRFWRFLLKPRGEVAAWPKLPPLDDDQRSDRPSS